MIQSTFDIVDRLMQAGADEGVFPGAVLWISQQGRLVWHKAYGWADLFARTPASVETVFDLASLTKPLATTLAVMRLVQQGAMDLDQPLSEQWSRWSVEKPPISLRKLLCHTSGLPAWQAYFMPLRKIPLPERMEAMRHWILDEPAALGTQCGGTYSDLGFLLLQWIVEDIGGVRLDYYIDREIYQPLGVDELFFIDIDQGRLPLSFAATELCPWRNRLLIGEVHDDNAYVLGGVAGHAGLFGTAAGVGKLLGLLLSIEGEGDENSFFPASLVSTFFQHQPGSAFALGFDTPSKVNSSAGGLFSTGSVGHLGFTGTSFWMDRQREIIVVLLTNRVHPSRFNERIKKFRPRLHDEIMMALIRAQAVV